MEADYQKLASGGAETREREGRRALVAMATFMEDDDDGDGNEEVESTRPGGGRPRRQREVTRRGSRHDARLAEALERAVDCRAVMFRPEASGGRRTRDAFETFVKEIQVGTIKMMQDSFHGELAPFQTLMRTDEFGILLFIVSSHGGTDSGGEFFFVGAGNVVLSKWWHHNKRFFSHPG